MATKRLTLNFPPHLIDQPVTYQLITEHNLKVNILRARITPREWGRLVVEIAFKTAISPELVSWVLHWSPHLKVLKPKKLRDEVIAKLREGITLQQEE